LPIEVFRDLTSGGQDFRYWCVDRNVEIGQTYRYIIQARDPSGNGILALSISAEVKGPRDFRLFQNYPNPFNAETTLSFQNPTAAPVLVTIYNARGQKVRTLLDAWEAPGFHLIGWDGMDEMGVPVASGIYFCQMCSQDFVDVKKMTVLR
jgi:hypothetical protein